MPLPRPHPRRRLAAALVATLGAWQAGTGHAAELLVRVTGLSEPLGQVGCSLFAGPGGFPMDSTGARVVWLAADAKGVTCRFGGVPEGRYAVAIAHDVNGNRRVDSNFLGLPTEEWGVSNNARPSLRAPRFDEAVFKVGADAREVVVDIQVAR
jgi:uncharacterized protein (DUF2141 family)